MVLDANYIYKKLKQGKTKYNEEHHCQKIIQVMLDVKKGRVSTFCTSELICEDTFYQWVNTHELFRSCYLLGRLFARETWEDWGEVIKSNTNPPGVVDHEFEHWKMIGWSRFGVGKNSRIKLTLNPDDEPNKHYAAILKQAANGDYTASEIKQLMEAINVGLNAHQVIQLQKELDQLKSDFAIMKKNSHVQNTFPNKGTEKKD